MSDPIYRGAVARRPLVPDVALSGLHSGASHSRATPISRGPPNTGGALTARMCWRRATPSCSTRRACPTWRWPSPGRSATPSCTSSKTSGRCPAAVLAWVEGRLERFEAAQTARGAGGSPWVAPSTAARPSRPPRTAPPPRQGWVELSALGTHHPPHALRVARPLLCLAALDRPDERLSAWGQRASAICARGVAHAGPASWRCCCTVTTASACTVSLKAPGVRPSPPVRSAPRYLAGARSSPPSASRRAVAGAHAWPSPTSLSSPWCYPSRSMSPPPSRW